MSDGVPDRPPRARLVEALEVRRNARRGFAAGLLFAVAVYIYFVAVPGTQVWSPVLYVALAFVVAVTTGLLATAVLTVLTARRLVGDID
jgi:hypothetical protein